MILKARFVVPLCTGPIENGAVEIRGGLVADVGPASNFPSGDSVDYGDAVILPGLVNAHTHLELSLLHHRVPPSPDFTDWLRRLIDARNADPGRSASYSNGEGGGEGNDAQGTCEPEDYCLRAVREGIAQSLSSGVTTIGDITAHPNISRRALAASPLQAVSFGEVIAMGRGRTMLAQRLRAASDVSFGGERLCVGVSPHSPYTVEPSALQACADVAQSLKLPICVHVAETREEDAFTRSADGPLAEFISSLGLWDKEIPRSGCSSVELLARTNLLGPRTLLAHANYVSDNDIKLIAASSSSVVYCPRTHAAFGHAAHRFREMIAAGVNTCIGTDSLASNPSLSVLDELRFLHERHGELGGNELLLLATRNGRRALGLGDKAGTLAPGNIADLAVVPISTAARSWIEVLHSTELPMSVYCQGERVTT